MDGNTKGTVEVMALWCVARSWLIDSSKTDMIMFKHLITDG